MDIIFQKKGMPWLNFLDSSLQEQDPWIWKDLIICFLQKWIACFRTESFPKHKEYGGKIIFRGQKNSYREGTETHFKTAQHNKYSYNRSKLGFPNLGLRVWTNHFSWGWHQLFRAMRAECVFDMPITWRCASQCASQLGPRWGVTIFAASHRMTSYMLHM